MSTYRKTSNQEYRVTKAALLLKLRLAHDVHDDVCVVMTVKLISAGVQQTTISTRVYI